MKLLDGGRAPNPHRVRIYLAEKGLSVETEQVDFMQRAHHRENFKKINPMQRLPVLILNDGTALSESMAICRYFEALNPRPPLFGTGARQIALVEMWNRRMELNLFASVVAVFRHRHPAMAELEVPQVPQWADANRPKVIEYLQWLDGELGKRQFIAGDAYSVADITAFVAVDFLKPARIAPPEGLNHLMAWHERMRARPSAAA